VLTLTIEEAKQQFLDRAKVAALIPPKLRGPLARFGGLTRTIGRRSMRPARRKKLSELTPAELTAYRAAQKQQRQVSAQQRAIRRYYGQPDPRASRYRNRWNNSARSSPRVRRPYAHSKPGEPPRTIRGDLKKGWFFALEPQALTLVSGPVRLPRRGDTPRVLDRGGDARNWQGQRVYVQARPYLGPALQKSLPKMPDLLRASVGS
jgi:hypothetical protein